MKYTSKEDKEGIRTALKTFLASKNETLSGVALKMGKTPVQVWQKVNVGNISHDYINELVAVIDENMELQKPYKHWVITKKTEKWNRN